MWLYQPIRSRYRADIERLPGFSVHALYTSDTKPVPRCVSLYILKCNMVAQFNGSRNDVENLFPNKN